MECGDITGIETALRSALRVVSFDPLCLAFAIDNSFGHATQDGCAQLSVETMITASVDELFRLRTGYIEEIEMVPIDCDDEGITTRTLLQRMFWRNGAGEFGVGMFYLQGNAPADCESDCSNLTLEDMVRKTIGFSVYLDNYGMRMAEADANAGPLTCDQDGLGTVSLLRAALADMGDGSFAWRYTVEP